MRKIETFRIEAAEPPGSVVRAKKLGRVEPHGFRMVLVHVRDRIRFGFDQIRPRPQRSVMTSAAFKSAARAKPALRCADTTLSRQNEKSAKPA